MITKEQAENPRNRTFHYGICIRTVGPRGGVTEKIVAARRTGQTKTWKRDQSRFRVPVCHGLWDHGEITEQNADRWHTADECPLYRERQ